MHMQCGTIRETSLGKGHPQHLQSIESVASCLRKLGRWTDLRCTPGEMLRTASIAWLEMYI